MDQWRPLNGCLRLDLLGALNSLLKRRHSWDLLTEDVSMVLESVVVARHLTGYALDTKMSVSQSATVAVSCKAMDGFYIGRCSKAWAAEKRINNK